MNHLCAGQSRAGSQAAGVHCEIKSKHLAVQRGRRSSEIKCKAPALLVQIVRRLRLLRFDFAVARHSTSALRQEKAEARGAAVAAYRMSVPHIA
eukprot:3886748-Rhodomonas_salina.1